MEISAANLFQPKGILHRSMGEQKYILNRYQPSPEVGYFVQHYWIVRWDLTGEAPYPQTVIAHPNVNMVLEPGGSRIYGISPTTSTHNLEGRGWVVGIKFKPGGFYPFWQKPVSGLTGSAVSLESVFGTDSAGLEEAIFDKADELGAIQRVDQFLFTQLPAKDPQVELVSSLVFGIREDRSMLKVEDVSARSGLPQRTLQRLFDRYVGVSPKSVIQRYRLHEAAERIDQGDVKEWVELSLELGYYDHSHFIRDFKAVIGVSPEEYVRRNA